MYANKLVAAIKVSGKVLREFKDTVYVPFGSEYSLLIKNLNSVRAVVNVYIDGEDMVPGGLVIDAGREIELERAIRNGNLKEGNRFKFIERTSAVEQHRGVGLEDGLIRLEYQFELPPVRYPSPVWSSEPWNMKRETSWSPLRSSGAVYGATNVSSTSCSVSGATMDWCEASAQSDAGITVPGSKSTQSFQTTTVGAMETDRHVLVFKLAGGSAVTKPVTVKHKPKCVTCGKQNRATAKFCTECGTALEIFA